MKNYLSLILFFCLSYLHLFADTYVWEDYDDFSGSSLDSTKWGIITFNGGIEPYHQDGSLILSSNGQDLNAVSQNESEWNELVSDYKQWGDPEVFYVIRDTDIVGVESSILMPPGTTNGTFFDLSFHEVDSSGQELTSRGIGIGLSQENGNTKIVMESEGETFTEDPISANLGQMYSISIIRRGDMCSIFLNEEQVGQISFFNFQPNLISLSAYNENQQGFAVEADNVRVLRRSTTTSLDGSTYSLSSSDGVSETLVFANGTFTSTFTDPEEGEIVTTDQSYILDQVSEDEFRIILGDGDTMEFNTATKSGKLTDYDSSGQIDTSGTWDFTFETISSSTVAISDPNGQPVVVQVGDDYQWNDTLDGVMLWGVWQDDDTNEWVIATVNYIGGRQKGAKGSHSSLPAELDVDHPYIVDGDTIDVTETNGHQYYQVTSVENGIIYAVDGDGAPLTDPSWWFTTRAAAEEFYNSMHVPRGWLWFDHYPWVYSFEENGWLYIQPYEDKFLYWSAQKQVWLQFGE